MTRRARGLALLGLAGVSAGLSASLVNGYTRKVSAQVGPLTPVLVAHKPVPRGTVITPANGSSYLSERRVPVRFAPPDAYRFIRQAIGLRALVAIPPGAYVDGARLAQRPPSAALARGMTEAGARLVEVPVAGAGALRGSVGPGGRVDVLITSERAAGAPQTYLALQRIELADLRDASGEQGLEGPDSGDADAIATLRVSLRQAVLLTAAHNFARELRLVARPRGDLRRFARTRVGAVDLGS